MKFYKSTAGCGYGQYAYLTPIDYNIDNKAVKNYLCIWTNENSNMSIYVEGQIVTDLEDIYLEEVELIANNYPLCQTFLFQFFMEIFNLTINQFIKDGK